ncbi:MULTISPECIES: S1 family peptidase [Acetobacterales]|uniref:S1 family peptidase n=1 Tax=Roseomonas sp. WGS1072 TaxID=3366816 RepID=UPI003BF1AA24
MRRGWTRRRLLVGALGVPALLSGCASPLAEQALGTPAQDIAATGIAALEGRGVAVAFDAEHVLTCAHLLGGSGRLRLTRGDGRSEAEGVVLARSRRMDLAVLRVPRGFLAPVLRAADRPREGETVWAAGVPQLGAGIARGHVEAPDAEMPGFGRGFTARMPALMGYSGGPVVDAEGRLLGLTSALPDPGAAGALALLTGADLDGLTRRDRRIFALAIHRAEAEALHLLSLAG